jgi:LPS-assembly protein
VFSGRHDLSPETRMVANVDYLSSFPYQEAFSNDFSQAASTDILSYAYGQHETEGYLAAFYSDRYQGLKRAASTASDGTAIPEEEVTIFHAPSLDLSTTDHSLRGTRVQWQFDGSAAGLKRSEPGFTSSGIIERVDLHPEISLPFAVGDWHFRPSLAVRDTFYSRSRETPSAPDAAVTESTSTLNRGDVEIGMDVRPPVIERTHHYRGESEPCSELVLDDERTREVRLRSSSCEVHERGSVIRGEVDGAKGGAKGNVGQ